MGRKYRKEGYHISSVIDLVATDQILPVSSGGDGEVTRTPPRARPNLEQKKKTGRSEYFRDTARARSRILLRFTLHVVYVPILLPSRLRLLCDHNGYPEDRLKCDD